MTTEFFASAMQRKLSACGDPIHAPSALAELFRSCFHPSSDSLVLRHVLQAELLRWTIKRAATQTRYYSRPIYRESIAVSPGAEPQLHCWPVITRKDVIENLTDMHAEGVTFGAICHTSGCTGSALSVYKSAEELSFIWDYQTQLLAPVLAQLDSRPLVLSMPNLYHGTPVSVPSIGKVFVAGVTDDLLLSDVVSLLRQRLKIAGHEERFSIITCLVHQMLFLTYYLLEHGIDPREFDIKSINIVGGYLTRRGREYLHNAWGAMIFDRFSLTESAGGATRCHECDFFHLDPHIIGEVLDTDTDEVLSEGVGRLVLTQLYPFVQMQPFVRYDTGDLVRLVKNNCHPAFTFEFAGKEKNCISWRYCGKTEWLILSVALNELLDPIPDFQRVEQFRGVHSSTDPSVGSLPIYTLTKSTPAPDSLLITLTAALRYSPHFYAERTNELKSIIRKGLIVSHPTLATRIAQKLVDLEVVFVGPGMLKDVHVLKI
ncbi:MAG TPA: hypothetical protein VJ023_06495 [Pyrinomonadaceae bacterium]|nr:hypothetical protein [Pyrinomonadaceae bacterium]